MGDGIELDILMFLHNNHPTEIAVALLTRSICSVQVASCLADNEGVYAWGWNSMGWTGMGQHAEAHCLSRANRKRLAGSTLYIASNRKRNGRVVTAKPCSECQTQLQNCNGLHVVYRDGEGTWRHLW